ncbi:MAG: hypothetical protein ACOY3K_00730 [Candidatus Omnitrophota bacterium]
MNVQHREEASGRWAQRPFLEQMAHIGSEVERALLWKDRGNAAYSVKAAERALELTDLTLANSHTSARRREIARVRETLADYFLGDNEYCSTSDSWKKYFFAFAYAARRNR